MTLPGDIKAAIFGMAGTQISAEEITFFRYHRPYGYILFARNCDSPAQIKSLTDSLRELSGREDVPILIDQEGGRVARLKPPHWRKAPAAGLFARLAEEDPESAGEATYWNARLLADELYALGITVNCAPMADIRADGSHDIIGDRAFGSTAEQVINLARAQAQGLLDGGVLPVLKHIPGHGRARVDSHEKLPVVETSLTELRQTDFAPFTALNDLPFAMTAHVLYTAIDPDNVATLSPDAIRLIREEIGFDGLLMSDDLSMKALSGTMGELTRRTLVAGCDVVLHCNGEMAEMQAVAEALPVLSSKAIARAEKAAARLHPPHPMQKDRALATVESLLKFSVA